MKHSPEQLLAWKADLKNKRPIVVYVYKQKK